MKSLHLYEHWIIPRCWKITVTVDDVVKGLEAAKALFPKYAGYLTTATVALQAMQAKYREEAQS